MKKNILPLSVEKRISLLSSNKEIFKSVAPLNQEALEKAGYNHKLTYQQKEANTRTKTKRVRSKGASWFNPPFSQHVKTNVFSGKTISLSILGLKIFPMAQRPTFLKFLLILSISEEHI